jgi:hypothetical protein
MLIIPTIIADICSISRKQDADLLYSQSGASAQHQGGDMMTTQVHRESAKIYQFPKRPFRRNGSMTNAAPPIELDAGDICYAALENCWYHQEAVREEADHDHRGKPLS